jgi:hypothetical protein
LNVIITTNYGKPLAKIKQKDNSKTFKNKFTPMKTAIAYTTFNKYNFTSLTNTKQSIQRENDKLFAQMVLIQNIKKH